MKNRLEYGLFVFSSALFCLLGVKLARKAASPLAYLFYYLIPIRKSVVLENLDIAFPDKSKRQKEKIALANYRSVALTFIELMLMPKFNEKTIRENYIFEESSLLTGIQRQGSGMLVISAHFGNWEFVVAGLSLLLGSELSFLVKPQRNTLVDEWVNRQRRRWGGKVVPLGASVKSAFKELLDKKAVLLAADQRGPKEGPRVKMFGRDSAVFQGPAVLALKSDAPIVMLIAVRQPDYRYRFECTELNLDDLPEDKDDKIREINQRHTNILEQYCKQYPEQWFWMHKRWKY